MSSLLNESNIYRVSYAYVASYTKQHLALSTVSRPVKGSHFQIISIMSSTTPKDQVASPSNKADYVADTNAETAPVAVAIDGADVAMQPDLGVDHNGLVVGRWKADIFACFNQVVPNCLLPTFCPCVSLAQTLHRVGMYTFNNVLIVFAALYAAHVVLSFIQTSSSSILWSWIGLALQLVAFVMVMVVRRRIRTAFQIPGSDVEDCACSFFCSCCVLAQMATQTESYTPSECTFSPKDTLPGYRFE
ncbi:hypothetical protein DYB37_013119 [Aphanomyces astaci]|uniref:PLAC8 family protein n=2 Tax=Aphanomyces astaci TaxID=112090 RepID=A0A397ECD2_APHAT|nr:hypothetical protein AaE_015061 [Aphanomyces astaci]RHY80150.1 hypothetical protein DYB30_013608 [Aphanomyces astaci]RHY98689.1 hypothetical protein DYB35_013119 [Aphanomyces astaci]RHZ06683.1 hypothetical protein DYB26_006185 [Aphanomyces astaci]RHZ28558.1 hypothetical protein DYB37_013119 [Aphanomyces astaci]